MANHYYLSTQEIKRKLHFFGRGVAPLLSTGFTAITIITSKNKTQGGSNIQPLISEVWQLPATPFVGKSPVKRSNHQRQQSLPPPPRRHVATSPKIGSPLGPTFAVANVKFPRRRSTPTPILYMMIYFTDAILFIATCIEMTVLSVS